MKTDNDLILEVVDSTKHVRRVLCEQLASRAFGSVSPVNMKRLAIAALCEVWNDADLKDAERDAVSECILALTE